MNVVREICLLSGMHKNAREICWPHHGPIVLYFFMLISFSASLNLKGQ